MTLTATEIHADPHPTSLPDGASEDTESNSQQEWPESPEFQEPACTRPPTRQAAIKGRRLVQEWCDLHDVDHTSEVNWGEDVVNY